MPYKYPERKRHKRAFAATKAMTTTLIGLSGPTGSGKTTLAKAFARHREVAVVKERVTEQQLREFELAPKSKCFLLQRSIITGRGVDSNQRQRPIWVFDRTVGEDIEVFVRMHRERALLSDREVSELKRLARDVVESIGQPHIHIFMTAPTQLLAHRIAEAKAPGPIRLWLEQQVLLYRRWRHQLQTPVLDLDTSVIKVSDLPEIVEWTLSSMRSILAHKRIFGPYGIQWDYGQNE